MKTNYFNTKKGFALPEEYEYVIDSLLIEPFWLL